MSILSISMLQFGGGGPSGQTIVTLVMLGAVFLVFYFLIIRPQNKRQKETKQMLSSLKKGDKVVTAGGIRGSIHSVKEDVIVIKVDDNTKIEFNKASVVGLQDEAAAKAQSSQKDESADDKNSEEEKEEK